MAFANRTCKKMEQQIDSQGPKAKLEELKNIMRFWLGMGCDGFRVDMAGSFVKHDKEFPEAAMVSEWGEPDKSLQGGFHMDFLLHFGPSHYNDLFRCENPFFAAKIVF